MNEIAEDNKRKPKLTVEEQIEHLKSKGVTFELCDEGEASRILSEQDHYFRLAAYRVLFPKRVGDKHDGEYAELDFGQLVDLAGIDQELRRFLLPLTLDVENAAKTKLVEKITDNRNEDGYSVLADYLTHLNHAERNRREGEISRLENDAYLGPLVERYPLDEMPAWVFLELSSFGAFASFYLFCANRWGDTEMRDDHYLLRRANSLRNAAAHSSAIINGLGISSATSTRYPASVAKALGDAGVSKRLRRSKMRNPRVLQTTVLAYACNRFVTRERQARAYDGFLAFRQRAEENSDWYRGNTTIISAYDFLSKVFQAWLSQR